MAISRLISSIYLGSSQRFCLHQRWLCFCHHCDPTAEDTWCVVADGAAAAGLHIHPDGAMLDLSGGPLRVLHPSDAGHFVSRSDIFADMFHLGTDVTAKEVQMEISAL